MTVAISCPDRASLERLLEKGAGPDEIERLAGHLENCARCGETVEGLLAADRTVSALRGAKVQPDESSIQLLRARLANLRLPAGAAAAQEATAAGVEATGAAGLAAVEMTQEQSVSLAPPQQPDEIGRLGGYRILKELGRGGMGVVFKAEDPKLKRLVALKAMLPRLAADAAARQRFLREAQSMAAVHHDHIVVIHAVDEDRGVPFLAMEFLQGMPLDQWLKGGRKPSIAQVLRLGREIAEALAAAHERGLIHRDVKPGNVWLDSAHEGRVKILDFGLARSAQEDVHLTQTGAIIGTPAYMAPEQSRGEKVDARGDLFSLGCVLYRLCTGAMPFTGDNTMSLLMALALDHPKPVREINAAVPAELSDLVIRLLEKDPARRPASAREVVQALQGLEKKLARKQDGDDRTEALPVAVAATPAPTPERSAAVASLPPTRRAVPPRRRIGALVGLLLGGAAVAAAVVAIVIIVRNKNGDKIAEVNVPPRGKVEIVDDGKKGGPAVAPNAAVDDAWLKLVAALPAEAQSAAVAAKLKERNPRFDGKVTPTIEGGVVTGLEFVRDGVTDLSPVRALPGLTKLVCRGNDPSKGELTDLSPLKGLKLTDLYLGGAPVRDLSPLKGMPLTRLDCNHTAVSDLSPLEGMKLTELNCGSTPVSDLSPLRGMPLTSLGCAGTKVSDLSPLHGMPLASMSCDGTPVSDLSPLKGMPLKMLWCEGMRTSDLSPLKGTPLKDLWCDFDPKRDAAILRSIPTLETINGKPAKEFWKDVDAKKP